MKHTINFANPIEQLPFFGDPIDQFIAVAEADGWAVDVIWEDKAKDPRHGIRTLQVPHDEVTVYERGGKVVHMQGWL